MLQFVETWMEENNYQSIGQFKGVMNAKQIKDGTAFERTQFFKYFSLKE